MDDKLHKSILYRISTNTLILTPIVASILPIVWLILTSHGKYNGNILQIILVCTILFLWGSTGIPMILRKEAPGFKVVSGWLAILRGILILICLWGPMIILTSFPIS